MVRSGTVWAWAAVAPRNIASANVLVSFTCFALEPAHFRSRIKSVAPASGRTRGPGRHAGMLRKRLHEFKQSPMNYSSRMANWGRCHSERERFRAKAYPGLDPGWTPVRVKKTRQNKRVEPGSDSIRTDKALGTPFARAGGGCRFTQYQRGTKYDVDDRRGGVREFSEQQSGCLYSHLMMFYPNRPQWRRHPITARPVVLTAGCYSCRASCPTPSDDGISPRQHAWP